MQLVQSLSFDLLRNLYYLLQQTNDFGGNYEVEARIRGDQDPESPTTSKGLEFQIFSPTTAEPPQEEQTTTKATNQSINLLSSLSTILSLLSFGQLLLVLRDYNY
jgi:hypothetical protein